MTEKDRIEDICEMVMDLAPARITGGPIYLDISCLKKDELEVVNRRLSGYTKIEKERGAIVLR